jgi:hypothetical protein
MNVIYELTDAYRLQGIVLVQTNTYFSTFKDDALRMRLFVAFIVSLNM